MAAGHTTLSITVVVYHTRTTVDGGDGGDVMVIAMCKFIYYDNDNGIPLAFAI